MLSILVKRLSVTGLLAVFPRRAKIRHAKSARSKFLTQADHVGVELLSGIYARSNGLNIYTERWPDSRKRIALPTVKLRYAIYARFFHRLPVVV